MHARKAPTMKNHTRLGGGLSGRMQAPPLFGSMLSSEQTLFHRKQTFSLLLLPLIKVLVPELIFLNHLEDPCSESEWENAAAQSAHVGHLAAAMRCRSAASGHWHRADWYRLGLR